MIIVLPHLELQRGLEESAEYAAGYRRGAENVSNTVYVGRRREDKRMVAIPGQA